MPRKISMFLEQVNNNLVAKEDCVLSINMSNYEVDNTIQDNDDTIWVKTLISKIEFKDFFFNIILDYAVDINVINKKQEDNILKLLFHKGDIILSTSMAVDEIKTQVNYVERLIGGKELFKDVGHLLQKIWGIYGPPASDMDLVHMEVLVSQCLRDRYNQGYPARLGKKWDPVMMNIKSTVFTSGFIQSLSFENIGKAITTGLISGEELPKSIIEKIMTGELVEKRT